MSGDKPYKLAFAVSLFFEYGGMQRSLLRIAQECVSRGHEVHIFTGGWIGERDDSIHVHELDTRALTNVRSNDRLARRLAEEIKRDGGFDAVIGFTKIPGLDVYYAGDPCYVERIRQTRPWWYRLTPRYRGLRRQEAAVFAKGLDTELMLIAHNEQQYFMHYYGTEAARFHLLPPGINKARFENVPLAEDIALLRAQLGVAQNEKMLLLVGARFKTKGLDRALAAIAALPVEQREQVRFVVVGGDKQGPYRRQAEQLGIMDRVVFTGAREDLVRFYHAADLLVHPPYSENTGTILIEAMLCSLPILVTDNCGFAYHVRDAGAGRVCPEPFSQSQFNRLLSEMIASEQLGEWAANGPKYCQQTDLYSLIERAADVIIARAARNREVA
ncbi:glycosyltransferase family 4 protein [Sulfuriflexus mobilis]|uniref:glycosyltransferase family 4 protein n=1 Tax=Sulfuriflexus mobilis TaxID=1811807 RepID=UPI00155966B5|nr:glycosyltransferase family 4 protein [Sulfuriflexus mobilis]